MQNETTTEQTPITPLFVYVDIMYRDAGNWKTSNSYLLPNAKQLSEEEIRNAFEDIGTEEVLCRQWGLPNQAPVDHSMLETDPQDHCFNEICDVVYVFTEEQKTFLMRCASLEDTDVSVVVDAVKNGGTEDWHAYDETVCRERVERSIRQVESAGFSVIKNTELTKLKASALPSDINPQLVQQLALMALSNPAMFQSVVDAGCKNSDLHKMQAAMAQNLGR